MGVATVGWSRPSMRSSPTKSTMAVPPSMTTPANMSVVASENTEVNPRSRSSPSGPWTSSVRVAVSRASVAGTTR